MAGGVKQIAPNVTRAAVLRDPAISAGIGQFAAIQSMAPSLGVEVIAVNVRDAGDIERDVTSFARSPNSGLIVTGSALTVVHRNLIIELAAQHRLPTVYFQRFMVTGGGLISYGPDLIDQYRRAANYVDRILRVRTRPIFQCRRRPNTSYGSISRQRRHLASKFRRSCSRSPTT